MYGSNQKSIMKTFTDISSTIDMVHKYFQMKIS